MMTRVALAATLMIPAFGSAMAASPAKTYETIKGATLTDERGMTLYTFGKDSKGKSACNGKCAENWPPFAASNGAQPEGNYTIVIRDDGSRQWAYKGRPLYTWIKDSKPGDITGDGFLDGAWNIAQP